MSYVKGKRRVKIEILNTRHTFSLQNSFLLCQICHEHLLGILHMIGKMRHVIGKIPASKQYGSVPVWTRHCFRYVGHVSSQSLSCV